MNDLVSVIVPTIGRPQYLRSTIESVLAQEYDNIEVLISDNSPKISAAIVLDGIIDSRIRIIERDRRYEFSDHMNLCINNAIGYYVMILSDDDLISENYISCMVQLFCKNTEVTVAVGHQKVLNESDINLGDNSATCENRTVDGLEYCLDHFHGKKHFPIYTYLSFFAKKNDICAAGGFKSYPDGSHADNLLFYSLALRGRIGVSNSLMGYRVYLASSGLSTPFDNLFQASLAFDKDMSSLIWGIMRLNLFGKIQLRRLVKISIAHTMVYRLVSIYKPRIGFASFLICICKVIFSFLPRNIFFVSRGS